MGNQQLSIHIKRLLDYLKSSEFFARESCSRAVIPLPKNLSRKIARFFVWKIGPATGVTPVAGLNLLRWKVSIPQNSPQNSQILKLLTSNVKVNPVISWNGRNSFHGIFPSNSQDFTTPQISFKFSGFYYTSNRFLIQPLLANDPRKRSENLPFSRNFVTTERKRRGQSGVMWTECHKRSDATYIN